MLSKVVRSLSLGILSLFAWGQFTKPTIAQTDIRPDTTLPGESSIVEGQGTLTFIEGGATRGSNLFHSFEEFNIRTGEGAYFLIPNLAIESVFSRITGNDPTNIDGVLGTAVSRESGVISGADLYLMNPNGILFGPNASLDLGGSFIATTSDAIQFDTQGSFSSAESTTPSDLLQINPTAFLFGSSPGTITNQSIGRDVDANSVTRGLAITPGNTLILVGGDVNLEGGQVTVPDGHVQIAAVASNGIVDLNDQGDEFFLIEIPASIKQGNVSISDGGIINVQGNTGGNIDIMARNINISNRSSLTTNIVSGANASNAQTGTINLDATEQIIIEQLGTIVNIVMANATGNAGNVNIRANTFILDGFGSAITTSNFGEGNAGAILINANTVRIDQGNLFSRIPEGRDGNAGNIEINANNISLSEAFLTTANRGTGNGGDITFNTGNLIATNGSNLTASIFGTGTSGNITLNTLGSVVLDGFRFNEDGEKLRTAIFTNIEENGKGQAGDIRINADSISLTNEAALYSNIREGGNGSGGNIFINGRTLAVADGAELNVNVLGQGIAGNILINVTGDVFFNGGDAFSNIGSNVVDTAAGGNIEINANSLYLTDSGQISTTALGQGNAGNIKIQTRDQVRLNGASDNVFGTVISSATIGMGTVGEGGDITIITDSLTAQNGAQIVTAASAQGTAGNIFITARDSVTFTGGRNIDKGVPDLSFEPSAAISSVENQGLRGGNIVIDAGSLNILNGAELNSETAFGASADAGDISIMVDGGLLVDGFGPNLSSSSINSASNILGFGESGDVTITADTVRVSNGGVITSQTGLFGSGGGDITVNSRLLETTSGGQLLTTTEGRGRSGDITVHIQEQIDIAGQDPNFEQRVQGAGTINTEESRSGLFTSTLDSSSGNGGTISLQSPVILLRESGVVSAQSLGTGSAGSIVIEVSDRLSLNNGNIITAANDAAGGDVLINTLRQSDSGLLILANNSNIITNSRNNGGNITIGATAIAFDDSDILARSQDANGGNILLGTFFSETLPPNNQAPFDGNGQVDINADGQLSAGTITTADTSFVQNSLAELSGTPLNPEIIVANSCIVRGQQTNGRFIRTGNSFTESSTAISPSAYSTGNVDNVLNLVGQLPSNRHLSQQVIEPDAIYKLADGRLIMGLNCR